MRQSDSSRPSREHLEAAAHEFRSARDEERDGILAARNALRRAEKAHDELVTDAAREVTIARAPAPLTAFGHELILYDDRVSLHERLHDLGPSVHARVEDSDGAARLVVEGPDWSETVDGSPDDDRELRQLAQAIEDAAGRVEEVRSARRPATESADGRLAAAQLQRAAVEEAKPMLEGLARIVADGERVLDMAPGIAAGHDGVLAVTDCRLLFVGVRCTLDLPHESTREVKVRGRLFGARLLVSTADARYAVGGLSPEHAREIARLARERIEALTPA